VGKLRKKTPISAQWMKRCLILMSVAVMGLVVYMLVQFREEPHLLIKGRIVIPPSLVDVAAGHVRLFYIIYSTTSAMPLAVMVEPIRMRVDTKQRLHGYQRSFAVTLSQLQFMQANGRKQLLAAMPSQNISSKSDGDRVHDKDHQDWLIKIRLDRDGRGGADERGDIISKKMSFEMGKAMDVVLQHRVTGK